MSDLSTRPPGNRPNPRHNREYRSETPPWFVILAGAVVLAILFALFVLIFQQDNSQSRTLAPTSTVVSSTTVSSTAVSSTTPAATGSTDSTIDPEQYISAVWPNPKSDLRYGEPTAAARGFVVDFLGFQDPIVGPFRQGDGRSGEVEIAPASDGPVTTILVRQLDAANSWWVLGAVTANITIDKPGALDQVDNPLIVAGSALALEGVVEVELRADGSSSPLIDSVVTGDGASREQFEASFDWTNPGTGSGALVLMITSADDGRPLEAAVTRVIFETN